MHFTRTFALLGGVAAVALLPATALASGPEGHGHGYGHGASVPEINGPNAAIALALVAGGAAVVLGRRRRQAR